MHDIQGSFRNTVFNPKPHDPTTHHPNQHHQTIKKKQAVTVLGQAQLKLELELYFTSFKNCCIKLIKLVKLYYLSGATFLLIPSKSNWKLF